MNQRLLRGLAAILVFSVLIVILGVTMKAQSDPPAQAQNTRELWKKVEQAEKDGLPQTAIDVLKQIAAASRE
ncbi:MAG: hypothetical protein MUP19_08985, partial [Candidatus Aminicenantes bacterium]|nr:hypothetical protein [Candidatus Aminicenantes bacterium]